MFVICYQGYKGRFLDGTKPWDSSDGLCPFRELEIQRSRDRGGWVEWDRWAEKGEGLSVPLYPAYRVLLPCLSPGPARDMQPTMKFVMDTSKYWFKPSISREQGKMKP